MSDTKILTSKDKRKLTTMKEETLISIPSGGLLRWLGDAYDQSQRVRIQTGERIRAIVQRRDPNFEITGSIDEDGWSDGDITRSPDELLKAIIRGDTLGPVPILGRTYSRHKMEESELQKEMSLAIKDHPAYPWLKQVRGIGPTLACKLLGRLDPNKAPHAGHFWSYTGLSVIPGIEYHCSICGLVQAYPERYNVTGKHMKLGSTAKCSGKLDRTPSQVYVAQVPSARGEKSTYDRTAKKIMFLIGTSFLKAGPKSPYEQHYRSVRKRLDTQKHGWVDARKHLSALRTTEKLFLAHLWQVWREALELPTPANWIFTHGEHDWSGYIDPWKMV